MIFCVFIVLFVLLLVILMGVYGDRGGSSASSWKWNRGFCLLKTEIPCVFFSGI